MRAASAFDSVASSLQQVCTSRLPLACVDCIASLFDTCFSSELCCRCHAIRARIRRNSSTRCCEFAYSSRAPSHSRCLGHRTNHPPAGHSHTVPFPLAPFSPPSFSAATHPYLFPPPLLSPSSPISPPSSVRPRRVRARNIGEGLDASSAATQDVEDGGSVRVSAFMPPNGIASPASSSPSSSRASSRNASRQAPNVPSPVPNSQHPNGVPSPHSSSPPSPLMSDS